MNNHTQIGPNPKSNQSKTKRNIKQQFNEHKQSTINNSLFCLNFKFIMRFKDVTCVIYNNC